MRVEDLDLKELLQVDPGGGLIHDAGQKALIFDAEAHGLPVKELIDTFCVRVARSFLSGFGSVHRRRMAEAMHTQFKCDTDEEWSRARARLDAPQGLFMLEPGNAAPFAPDRGGLGGSPTKPSGTSFTRARRNALFAGRSAGWPAATWVSPRPARCAQSTTDAWARATRPAISQPNPRRNGAPKPEISCPPSGARGSIPGSRWSRAR
jgi:hypothetical protein